MAKYDPLRRYLSERPGREWRARFEEVEGVLGFALPISARRYAAWWANELKGSHSHCRAWLGAGWHTGDVDLAAEQATFRRGRNVGRAARRGPSRWQPASQSVGSEPPSLERAHNVVVRFTWRRIGPVELDAGGRLMFRRVDDGPAVYRFRFDGAGKTRLYVGETDVFSRRLQHYRTPGPTQRTNRRIKSEIETAIRAADAVTLERVEVPVATTVDGHERRLDLTDRIDRRLVESAALAAARGEADDVLNR